MTTPRLWRTGAGNGELPRNVYEVGSGALLHECHNVLAAGRIVDTHNMTVRRRFGIKPTDLDDPTDDTIQHQEARDLELRREERL